MDCETNVLVVDLLALQYVVRNGRCEVSTRAGVVLGSVRATQTIRHDVLAVLELAATGTVVWQGKTGAVALYNPYTGQVGVSDGRLFSGGNLALVPEGVWGRDCGEWLEVAGVQLMSANALGCRELVAVHAAL